MGSTTRKEEDGGKQMRRKSRDTDGWAELEVWARPQLREGHSEWNACTMETRRSGHSIPEMYEILS